MEQRLTLPMPPSTNTLYRNVAGKGRVTSARYMRWKEAAATEALLQRQKHIGGPVEVSIRVKRDRRSDIDNRVKAAVDFLVSQGFIDDDRTLCALLLNGMRPDQ